MIIKSDEGERGKIPAMRLFRRDFTWKVFFQKVFKARIVQCAAFKSRCSFGRRYGLRLKFCATGRQKRGQQQDSTARRHFYAETIGKIFSHGKSQSEYPCLFSRSFLMLLILLIFFGRKIRRIMHFYVQTAVFFNA